MKAYKLTTQELTTHNGFKWEVGVPVTAQGEGNDPCSDGVLHYYKSPYHAALFNSIHACVKNPILWEIETSGRIGTDGLKSWCKTQTLVRQIPLPEITTEQRVGFAIRCARQTKGLPKEWREWAEAWLSGADRSEEAAARAARAAGWAQPGWAAALAWAARAAETETAEWAAIAETAEWAAEAEAAEAEAAEAAERAAEVIQRAIDETFGG